MNKKNKKLFAIVGVAVVLLTVTGISVSTLDKSSQPSRTDPATALTDVTTEDVSQPPEEETTTPTTEVPDVSAPKNTFTQEQADPVLDVEQEDQADVDLTDSEKKPKTTPPPAPFPKEQQAVSESGEPTVSDLAANQPQNGSTQNGSTYIEGFGWVPDEDGSSVRHNIGPDGNINKQVGIMGWPLAQKCGISVVPFLCSFSKISRLEVRLQNGFLSSF